MEHQIPAFRVEIRMKFIFAILAGSLLSSPLLSSANDDPDGGELPLEDLRVFAEVFGKIKSEYVDNTDDETLLQHAIGGMLAGLDPHSTFLDPCAEPITGFLWQGSDVSQDDRRHTLVHKIRNCCSHICVV